MQKQFISLENQNFISISRKIIVSLCRLGVSSWKEIRKNNALCERCSFLYYRCCDVFGLGKIEFLTDLGLALVDGLHALAREHVDLLGGEIRFKQTT